MRPVFGRLGPLPVLRHVAPRQQSDACQKGGGGENR
jgi:hypothetical protein